MHPGFGLSLLVILLACDDNTPAATPVAPPFGPVATISISPTGQSIASGDSLRFQASTNVPAATGFTWTVDKAELASINAQGWLKALGSGTVTVQACVLPPTWAVCGNAVLTIH